MGSAQFDMVVDETLYIPRAIPHQAHDRQIIAGGVY
jgi:hypothetical protein